MFFPILEFELVYLVLFVIFLKFSLGIICCTKAQTDSVIYVEYKRSSSLLFFWHPLPPLILFFYHSRIPSHHDVFTIDLCMCCFLIWLFLGFVKNSAFLPYLIQWDEINHYFSLCITTELSIEPFYCINHIILQFFIRSLIY